MHATGPTWSELEAGHPPADSQDGAATGSAARSAVVTGVSISGERSADRSRPGECPSSRSFGPPGPAKPEVFLLCDISGSMATFARFTLQFVYAMSGQFSKLRSFAFIDALDEVTDYFQAGVDFGEALHRVSTEAEVVWLDGHSDYGRSLEQFWTRFGGNLTASVDGDHHWRRTKQLPRP